ncbi:RING finger protein [Senna tora]|uniref:RING finger protein n=1 Tax=Senna tora TaxID=362788 RepID=A0A834W2J7_9FABA|nr:RING finger protein [Senna tora]
MRDVKCRMKYAPTANRKEEPERLNHNDAPIVTRLTRSKDKEANNHTDKQRQPSKQEHDKSNHSEAKKSEVQPAKVEDAKKMNDSSRNDLKKKQLGQKKASQASKSETGNVSSLSHCKEKEKSTRPSQEPPKRAIEESTRRCEGFGNATQCMVYICQLCEKDLAVSPIIEEAEPPNLPPQDQLYSWGYLLQQEEEQDNSLLPEVCVFSCGHVFHSLCFQLAQHEEQLSSVFDPTCPICLSFS